MAVNFNVVRDSRSQLKKHPELTKDGVILPHAMIDLTDVTCGLAVVADFLAYTKAEADKAKSAKVIAALKGMIYEHGFRAFRDKAKELPEPDAKSVNALALALFPALAVEGGKLPTPLIGFLVGRELAVAVMAREILTAKISGAAFVTPTQPTFKSAIKTNVAEWGRVGNLGSWKEGLDADTAAAIEKDATDRMFGMLPALFEGSDYVPPVKTDATVREGAAPPAEGAAALSAAAGTEMVVAGSEPAKTTVETVSESSEKRSLEELKTALRAAKIEFRKKANHTELAALAAAKGV